MDHDLDRDRDLAAQSADEAQLGVKLVVVEVVAVEDAHRGANLEVVEVVVDREKIREFS